MNLEQYVGCWIKWNGRVAEITGCTDCYEGSWFTLRLQDGSEGRADACDAAFLKALPDPKYGILKKKDGTVFFEWNGTEYELDDHPYEPCIYIKQDGKVIFTLHNAFTVDWLPEHFAEGKTVADITGTPHDRVGFCRILSTAIESGLSETEFYIAAKTAEELAKDDAKAQPVKEPEPENPSELARKLEIENMTKDELIRAMKTGKISLADYNRYK